MVRPRKPEGEKKNKRLTVYLTEQEEEQLDALSKGLEMKKTKIFTRALENYVKTLDEPPEPLKQAKKEMIMDVDTERVNGYICSNGHAFWLEFELSSKLKYCPTCGSEDLRRTWMGIVKKGF